MSFVRIVHEKILMNRTCMDDRVLRDNTIFCRIGLHDLELNGSHATADEEGVALAHGSVRWKGYDV